MEQRSDLACAGAVVAYGIVLIAATTQQDVGTHFDNLGPRGLPFATGALLVLMGGVIVIRRIVAWSPVSHRVAEEGTEDEEGHPASFPRVALIAALTFGYAALLSAAGFLIATPVYMAVGLKVMQRSSPWLLVLVPLVFTAVVFAVFSQALGVPLPVGPLGGVLIDLGLIDAIR